MLATAFAAAVAGSLEGMHGALSAALGGLVGVAAGAAAAWVAARRRRATPGDMLVGALAAEGVKLALAGGLLWLAFALYGDMVVEAFLGTFVATVLIFSMAFFVSDRN
jgi:ATP synthase protein I